MSAASPRMGPGISRWLATVCSIDPCKHIRFVSGALRIKACDPACQGSSSSGHPACALCSSDPGQSPQRRWPRSTIGNMRKPRRRATGSWAPRKRWRQPHSRQPCAAPSSHHLRLLHRAGWPQHLPHLPLCGPYRPHPWLECAASGDKPGPAAPAGPASARPSLLLPALFHSVQNLSPPLTMSERARPSRPRSPFAWPSSRGGAGQRPP